MGSALGCALGRDVYTQDPVVCRIWKELGAVPVLPIHTKLGVYSVLRREVDGFTLLGDLGNLCALGPHKSELQRVVSTKDTTTEALGTVIHEVVNDSRWLAKLGLVQIGGGSIGITDVYAWKVVFPSYHLVSATDIGKFEQTVKKFTPNSYCLENRRKFKFWVVREVITAPEFTVHARDRWGREIGFEVPTGLPLALNVGLEASTGGGAYFYRRGALEADGSGPRALPIAFRGNEYEYANGFIKKLRPNRNQADGVIEQVPYDASQTDSHSSDMRPLLSLDFVLSIRE